MESFPPFAELPHIVSMSGLDTQTYDSYDSSLPADHPFVMRATHFDYPLPSYEQIKAHNTALTPQPWWKSNESAPYPASMGYLSQGYSSWNRGYSSLSDPQSPRSSYSGSLPLMNCVASPDCREELSIPSLIEDRTGYPAPDGLVDTEKSIGDAKPRLAEAQPHYRLSTERQDLDSWSSGQSDRNVTPEQQWSTSAASHLAKPVALPQSVRRVKNRTASTSRVCKSTEKRPSSGSGRNRRRRGVMSADGTNSRVFVCSFAPYGCESTFVSKNEWKRHVTSQHLQLGFYRCDVGKCNAHCHQNSPRHFFSPQSPPKSTSTVSPGQPNDFNRKDLFTQHQRRMHAPWLQSGQRRTPTDAEHAAFETSLEEVRQRCWHGLRQPPMQSYCGFCQETFSGEGSWDTRMEHVGRHFEREDQQTLGKEAEDVALREWGLNEGILTIVDGKCRLASLVGGDF